jgi:peptidoglycan-N-acetylglucosamine deacetylase
VKRLYHRLQRILTYYKQYYNRRIKYINNSFSKQLVLTFDDGPHPVLTRQILAILEKYKINATFFFSGTAIEKTPNLVKEIFGDGYILGNHGYEHLPIDGITQEDTISGFEKTDTLIKKLTGKARVAFYRPPYGKTTRSYLFWIYKKRKYTVEWSLDSYDYRNEFNTDQIVEMLLRDVKNGDILLFHDTKHCTPEILKIVIPELLSRNFSFIRLDQKFK